MYFFKMNILLPVTLLVVSLWLLQYVIDKNVFHNLLPQFCCVRGIGIFAYENLHIKQVSSRVLNRLEPVTCNCLGFLVLLVIINLYLNIV